MEHPPHSGTRAPAGFGEAGDGGGGACRPVNETCATGVECCTGLCERDSVGEFPLLGWRDLRAPAGGSCTVARDCRSLNCVDNPCASKGLCLQTGQACDANDPGACCTGLCSNGQCVKPPMSACDVAGERCTQAGASSSCCSKVCLDYDADAGSDLRCGASGACRARGETCTKASDCCSFVCGANGLCQNPPGSGGLVAGSALTGANAPAGEVCPSNNSCAPNNDYCRPTLFGENVRRCAAPAAGTDAGPTCKPVGATCTARSLIR